MAWFKKESKTHFIRDESGKVIDVEVEEIKPRFASKTPIYDAAKRKYYEEHPDETKTARFKKAGSGIVKAVDTWADNYVKNTQKAKTRQRYEPARRPARKYTPVSTKMKPYRSPFMNIDPVGGMSNIWGPRPSQKKTSNTKREYVIKGGVAYPIHKQITPKKSKRKQGKEFDLFDNHGFF